MTERETGRRTQSTLSQIDRYRFDEGERDRKRRIGRRVEEDTHKEREKKREREREREGGGGG